jgi:hypothetical protein
MPLYVITMQPLNIAYPCLESVVSIANKKHTTIEELKVRV